MRAHGEIALPRLREQSALIRLGLTGIVLTLLIGFGASAGHLREHHENRDGEPGVSMDDLRGAYHGLDKESPLIAALERDHPPELAAAERALLLDWLRGGRVSEDYDNLDLGDSAPAEVLDRGCLRCHARQATEGDGIGETISLEYWDDVEKVAFSRKLDAVPTEILLVSLHTHALSLAAITLALGLLILATRWAALWRHGLFAVGGLAMLIDLASWWLARSNAGFVFLIAISGAVYMLVMTLSSLAVLVDLWLPGGIPKKSPDA